MQTWSGLNAITFYSILIWNNYFNSLHGGFKVRLWILFKQVWVTLLWNVVSYWIQIKGYFLLDSKKKCNFIKIHYIHNKTLKILHLVLNNLTDPNKATKFSFFSLSIWKHCQCKHNALCMCNIHSSSTTCGTPFLLCWEFELLLLFKTQFSSLIQHC